MGVPVQPPPTKYFIAFLLAERSLMAAVEAEIAAAFGAIDGTSAITAWQESKFYQAEMGASLWRGFCSLSSLRSAADLAAVKLQCGAIEDKFRDPRSRGRRINLDPGYLDTLKVVLASTKNANQRIYLGSGIFAEATLFYHHHTWHGLPYSYADYLAPTALEFFTQMRAIYVKQLRDWQ